MPFISSHGLLEERKNEKKAMTKEKEWEDLGITSYCLDVEIIRPFIFSLFLWTVRQTWLVMGIALYVEPASSGFFIVLLWFESCGVVL